MMELLQDPIPDSYLPLPLSQGSSLSTPLKSRPLPLTHAPIPLLPPGLCSHCETRTLEQIADAGNLE